MSTGKHGMIVSMSTLPRVETLRERRERAHLTRAQLAALAGVSVSTLVRLEQPDYMPTLRTLRLVEAALERAS